MFIQLMHRRRGVQRPVRQLWINCRYESVVLGGGGIDEAALLSAIPRGWLPAPPGEILLTLANPKGSTGLLGLTVFRPWSRYYNCYILELWKEAPHR